MPVGIMPQPLKNFRGNWRSGGRLVLERPELAMRFGLIATAWSYLENYIIIMFSNHSGIPLESAFIIHDSITNLQIRLSVIRSIMKQRVPNSLYKNLVAVEQDILKRAGERNAIVHGAWAISDDLPDDLIRQPLVGHIVWSRQNRRSSADFGRSVRNL